MKIKTNKTDAKTNKYLLIGIGVFIAVALLTATSLALGVNFTGFFKAFDKTVYPGTQYTRNITIRKFYNATVRFTKGNSTSYLKFDDNDSVIILKDAEENEILRLSGIEDGKSYVLINNSALASIAKVSVYNIEGYEDVVDHTPVVTTVGTKAYVTISLEVTQGPSSISGYITDDLTGELVSGVRVLAFEDEANPDNSTAITQSVSDEDGMYLLTFDLDDKKSFDIYVEDYYAVK